MANARGLRALLGVPRRHKVLAAVGAGVAMSLFAGVVALVSGVDAAAVDAVVGEAEQTSVQIDAAHGALADTIEEAVLLATQVRGELDAADEADLQEAIAAAQSVAGDAPVTATPQMSLAEAKKAHAEAEAHLAGLESVHQELRAAMDAAAASHEAFLASALTDARSAFDDARQALRVILDAADQVLSGSAGRVADESVRDQLRVAIEAARTASGAQPDQDHRAYGAATEQVVAAGRQAEVASDAVTAAVAAQDEADRIAAEQAAAEQAAAEQAAAEQAAAEQAAAEQAAAEQAAAEQAAAEQAERGDAEAVVYASCRAAWDAGAAPLYAGDPGYGRHLDRDGDGVACENSPWQ